MGSLPIYCKTSHALEDFPHMRRVPILGRLHISGSWAVFPYVRSCSIHGKTSHIWQVFPYMEICHIWEVFPFTPLPMWLDLGKCLFVVGVLLCGECTSPENNNTNQIIQVRSPPYGGILIMWVHRPILGCFPRMRGCTASYGNPFALASSFHAGRGNTRVCQNPG
jgi:hypothetical protein